MFGKNTAGLLLLVVVSMVALFGCGTILYGAKQDLSLNTVPAGLMATVDGQSCTTPCILNISRKAQKIQISDGTTKRDFNLIANDNTVAYVFGNILFAGFPGWILDDVTGGRQTIAPVSMFLSNEFSQPGSR